MGFYLNGACLVCYWSCWSFEPWLNSSRAAHPDIVTVPLLLSHPKVLPLSIARSPGESLFRSAHELLQNRLIFQVIDCLAGEKRSNHFHLIFLGNITVSVVLWGRQHPLWLTAALLVIWINTAQILENWILTGKLQPLPTQPADAEEPLNLMAVYTWLIWSCNCRLMKHLPIAWAFCQSLWNSLDFSITVFPSRRFNVFNSIASLWSLLAWVMGCSRLE